MYWAGLLIILPRLIFQKANQLMAETPPHTPERFDQPEDPATLASGLTVKKTTKIIRTASRMYATQITTGIPSRSVTILTKL